jgi:hypothetical protein
LKTPPTKSGKEIALLDKNHHDWSVRSIIELRSRMPSDFGLSVASALRLDVESRVIWMLGSPFCPERSE